MTKKLNNLTTNWRKLFVIVVVFALVMGVTGCGDEGEADTIPTPTASTCHADFTADYTELNGPTVVYFYDRSICETTSWAWDFNNDGIIDDTRQNPNFFYPDNGSYSVTLTVKGPNWEDTRTIYDYINVTGCST